MIKRTVIFFLLTILTMATLASVPAEDAAASPYLPCEITVPEGRENAAGNLLDDNDATRFTLKNGQSLTVTWTGEASGVLLRWYDTNYRATINFYAPTGEQISSTVYPSMEYRMFLPAEGANRMEIVCARGEVYLASLCELRVCAAGYTPPLLTKTEPVDLMLVLSGVSEETDLMGGLLPVYAVEHDVRTAVIYVGKDDGNRVQEGFRALEAMGAKVIPVFLERDDQATCSIDRMVSYWKEATLLGTLTDLIAAYRPRVIVTCDPQDTFSMVRTPFTARLMLKIMDGDKPGTKSVQKFYHLSAEGETVLDWTQPLVSYGGRTAREAAQDGYACYRSEECYGTVIPESCRFRLAFSRVGADEAGNDLFEHIDTGSLMQYVSPTATPAVTKAPETPEPPTPEAATEQPSVKPTPAPQETAAPTEAPSETTETARARIGGWAIALFVLCAVLACAALCVIRKKRTAALILLGIAAACLIVGLLLPRHAQTDKQTELLPEPTATAAPTASPTEEPTPEPTEEPTPEPTAEPTPTPDPNDRYFRQEGEPEEVVIQDYENGYWEYRSDILSVTIERQAFRMNNHPYCQYIAHIRMRKINSFRSIVSSHYDVATASEPPWRLSRNYRAVFAITGDNINNADLDYKGILLRRGILYSDRGGEDTLVMRDDFTMQILHRKEISGIDLMDSGVLNTYSFGPTLVENYEINPDVSLHRVSKENPRCGVGMVEPGHFVAIVTDGRDESRAYGYTMEQFAKLFQEQGVQVAYNLDGGNSAAMVFMGEHVNWHSKGVQRTWADALAWGFSRLVPDPTVIATHRGEGVFY